MVLAWRVLFLRCLCMAVATARLGHASNNSSIIICVVGQFLPRPNATACETCAPGQYADATGMSACKGCVPGRFQDGEGKSTCMACAEDTVQPRRGNTSCVPCVGTHRVPDHSHSTCDCENDFYAKASGECVICPRGAMCCKAFSSFIPADQFRIRARRGYWVPPGRGEDHAWPFQCPIPEACPGLSSITGDTTDPTSCNELSGNFSDAVSLNATCRAGHTGVACGVCKDEYKPGPDRVCVKCAKESKDETAKDQNLRSDVTKMFILFCLSVVLVVGGSAYEMFFGTSKKGRAMEEGANQINSAESEAESTSSHLNVLIPYVQRIGAIDRSLPYMGLPQIPLTMVAFLKLLYADFSALFRVISPCELHIGYASDLGIALGMFPWLSVVLTVTFILVAIFMRRKRGYHRAETKARLIGTALYAGKVVHPFISQTCLKIFICTDLGDGMYLTADLSVKCSSSDPKYVTLMGFSFAGCVLLVLGIPLLLLRNVMLDRWRIKRDARKAAGKDMGSMQALFRAESATNKAASRLAQIHQSNVRRVNVKLHRSVTPFTAGTKPEFYWLFVLEMFISFVFIAFCATLAGDHVELQITLAIVMAVVQILVPTALKPYQEAVDARTAVVGAVVYGIIQLTALTKYFALTAQSQTDDESDGKAVMSAILIAKLRRIDTALSIIFVGGVACLLLSGLLGLFSSARAIHAMIVAKLCKRKKKKSGWRVAPSVGSGGPRSVAAAAAQKGESKADAVARGRKHDEEDLDTLPNTITRPPARTLSRLPAKVLHDYVESYRQLHEIHTQVVIVGIQAIVRGNAARRAKQRRTTIVRQRQQQHSEVVKSVWGNDDNLTQAGTRLHCPEERARVVSALQAARSGNLSEDDTVKAEGELKRMLQEYSGAELAELLLSVSREGDQRLAKELHKKAALEHKLRRNLEREDDLERVLELKMEKERVMEMELREKEDDLERVLELKREKEKALKRELTMMRSRMVDKHLEKAQDEARAKQILDDHAAETEQHREQLQQEERKRKRESLARNKRRRFKHVLAALRDAVGDRTDEEIEGLLDKNGDRVIELKELWNLLQTVTLASGHAVRIHDARAILHEFDTSRDSTVSVDELLEGIRGLQKHEKIVTRIETSFI